MKIDTALFAPRLIDVPAAARRAEELGFDGIWSQDTSHNPMFPLVLAAEHTTRIQLGTAILVAFARSPMDVAYQAWDLAQLSGGRFILGLGTQVKPHIEKRFSMLWGPPVEQLREYIQALRHIWSSWQTGERINFRGEHYKLTLMTPFFNPGPIEHPEIPVYIAGVNEGLCRLAGQMADGFHLHPYHSVRYLRELVIPWIESGAREAGRTLDEVTLTTTVFVITGRDEEEMERNRQAVRQQVAFYASTPTYRTIMEVHGWEDVADQLRKHATRQRWSEMPELVTDEMLEAFAVSAAPDEVAGAVQERYDGLLDRVTYYEAFIPNAEDTFWRETIRQFREHSR
jgi:probable F420-dependent oxidoreductase